MNPDPMYEKRLRSLAKHLRKGQLLLDEWRFSTVLEEQMWPDGQDKVLECKSVGCAVGETLMMFPLLSGGERERNVREFYGLTVTEYMHLFYPLSQCRILFGGGKLETNATKEQVAEHIMTFLERMESSKNEFRPNI